ncbi:MAG: hypothetical protein AAGF26_02325 [Cyanobacteria bacterium P01_G01_bin.49]
MFKLIAQLKKSAIFMGLTAILTTLTPSIAMSQSAIDPSEQGWINLSCDGEPGMTLNPDKQALIRAALADNEQLQSLFGELGEQKFTASLLDGFLAMANYGLGEFRRQSEGTSIGLLTLFLDEQTLEQVSQEVKSQWEQEMQQACLDRSTDREYIWRKP